MIIERGIIKTWSEFIPKTDETVPSQTYVSWRILIYQRLFLSYSNLLKTELGHKLSPRFPIIAFLCQRMILSRPIRGSNEHLHLPFFGYSCSVVLSTWNLDNLHELGGFVEEPSVPLNHTSPLKAFTGNTSAKLTILIIAWFTRSATNTN